MRKILILFLIVSSFGVKAQYVSGSTVQASQNLIVSGTKVNGIDKDTAMAANDSLKLATQHAIKSYVDNRMMGGGAGGSYHLPYNGISTNYLGGDTIYHALPTIGGNDTAMVHIDSIAGHPSWVQFYHSNRSIPSDTLKFNIPKTIVAIAKNVTRDSVLYTFSDGTIFAIKDSVGSGGVGSSSLSGLTAATAPNTIYNAALTPQVWRWDNLDSTTAFTIASNSTGSITRATMPVLVNFSTSGANAYANKQTYGLNISNTHTGSISTNYALVAIATGGNINNAASFVGNVSISPTAVVASPAFLLDVRGTIGTASIYTNTWSPYSGTGAVSVTYGLSVGSGVYVPIYTGMNYNYGKTSGIGYAAAGNDLLSTSGDTSITRINGNSKLQKVGISGQNIKISDSTVVDASKYNYKVNAILDLASTSKAFLPPRLTTTQRDAIVLTGVQNGTLYSSVGTSTTGIYNITFTGGTGSGAAAKVYANTTSIFSVIITSIGSGYTVGDVLTSTVPIGTLTWSYTVTELTGTPGLMIYNTTTGKLNFLNNSATWEAVTSL